MIFLLRNNYSKYDIMPFVCYYLLKLFYFSIGKLLSWSLVFYGTSYPPGKSLRESEEKDIARLLKKNAAISIVYFLNFTIFIY